MVSDAEVTVERLRSLVAEFVSEREWERYHDPKNLAMSIAIEAGELMEHFQWVRSDELPALMRGERTRSEIEEEIADVLCYVLALANVLELDLSDALRSKMEKNAAKYPVERFRGQYFKPGED